MWYGNRTQGLCEPGMRSTAQPVHTQASKDSLWSIWPFKVWISHHYLAVSELFHWTGTHANILLSFTCVLLKITIARDTHCPVPFSLLGQVSPHQKCKCLSNLTISSSIHLLTKSSRYKLNVKQTLNVKKKKTLHLGDWRNCDFTSLNIWYRENTEEHATSQLDFSSWNLDLGRGENYPWFAQIVQKIALM